MCVTRPLTAHDDQEDCRSCCLSRESHMSVYDRPSALSASPLLDRRVRRHPLATARRPGLVEVLRQTHMTIFDRGRSPKQNAKPRMRPFEAGDASNHCCWTLRRSCIVGTTLMGANSIRDPLAYPATGDFSVRTTTYNTLRIAFGMSPGDRQRWLADSDASPSLALHSAPAGPSADGDTSLFLQTKRLLDIHHTPHAAHPRPHSHFTELENGTLDHLTQFQLVRAASQLSATSARSDIGLLEAHSTRSVVQFPS
ncbi:hypothetical protein EV715DRAFT_268460 [Schizophyllum commune]